MTKQEIYNRVKAHAIAQPWQAHNAGSCAYRTPSGDKCFAGVLIDDAAYSPEMEGLTWHALVARFPHATRHISYPQFVFKLQQIHDRRSVERWEQALAELAQSEGIQA